MRHPSCAWLLHPVSELEFFDEYWERQPLVLNRSSNTYYDTVLSLPDIDDLISSAKVQTNNIRLVKDQSHAPSKDFVSNDGVIDPIEVMRFFDTGYTIILEQMHRYITGLHQLCEKLTDDLDYDFQTNLYLTPALSQGFGVHYDTHDVFILQVYGEKEWAIYDSPIRLPLPGQTHELFELSSRKAETNCVLTPGDLLYIPRGFYHSATSLDTLSLHITLGALTKTWTDILIEAVAVACTKDPVLRESLPPRALLADKGLIHAKSRFDEHWQRVSNLISFDEVITQLSAEAIRQRRPHASNHFSQIAELNTMKPCSVVKARSVPFQWDLTLDHISIIAFEKSITFPRRVLTELQVFLSGKETSIEDVSGSINMEGKLTLARRLVLEGLLDVIQR